MGYIRVPSFRYRLLFVGVNAVPGSPPLHAAARDAEAMSARFRGWGYEAGARHRLLLNQDATAARVLDEVRSASAAADLDLLLIYWAGHLHANGRKHILTTHDDGADTGSNGIGLDVLTGAIGRAAGVPHRLLILDTCNAAAAHSPLGALSRHVADEECVAVLAAGGSDAMSREDHRRGYFTGALLEQLPRDTRGLPPNIDVLHALRVGADHLTERRQEKPFVGVYGTETELRLPDLSARTLSFEARARVGRLPGKLIAAQSRPTAAESRRRA
jgi:hypothetical protein